jgi:DNA-binding SARP family transcriptional activator
MGRVRFRVLGPLEVVGPEGVVAVGGPLQRALLAVLLLAGGRPVARDRLIDELWGDRPPATGTWSSSLSCASWWPPTRSASDSPGS